MEQNKFKALLVSVGGSPSPIKYVIQKHTPEHIWFFCSDGSRNKAEEILKEVKKQDYHPNARFIEVLQYEELGPCYLELRKKIPELLKEHKIDPEEVLVDYTGGTKTMSAALVLAAVECFKNFSYVGGKQRTNDGTGIVMDGQEKWIYQLNPWKELAVREIEKAIALWNEYLFDAAANIIEEAAKLVPQKEKFKTIAKIARGMAARHHFNFNSAVKHLGDAHRILPALYDGKDASDLMDFVRSSLEICQKCREQDPSVADKTIILRELLDNCLRCEKQQRYEDAAATLYRAMELQVQIWLEESTNGAFKLGRLQKDCELPEQLKGKDYCKPDQNGEIKLALEKCIEALNDLGDRRVEKIFPQLKKGSDWRKATEKRNAGIRAHGLTPVDAEAFNEMKRVASELLGFNLNREHNPILPMDQRWFL